MNEQEFELQIHQQLIGYLNGKIFLLAATENIKSIFKEAGYRKVSEEDREIAENMKSYWANQQAGAEK